jgi:hypothetical protein
VFAQPLTVPVTFLGGKARLALKADNIAAICEPTV